MFQDLRNYFLYFIISNTTSHLVDALCKNYTSGVFYYLSLFVGFLPIAVGVWSVYKFFMLSYKHEDEVIDIKKKSEQAAYDTDAVNEILTVLDKMFARRTTEEQKAELPSARVALEVIDIIIAHHRYKQELASK